MKLGLFIIDADKKRQTLQVCRRPSHETRPMNTKRYESSLVSDSLYFIEVDVMVYSAHAKFGRKTIRQ